MSDISALKYDYKYSIRKYENKEEGVFNQSGKLRIYIGFKGQDIDVASYFDDVEERFVSKDYSHIVGQIDISKLKNKDLIENPNLSLIVLD